MKNVTKKELARDMADSDLSIPINQAVATEMIDELINIILNKYRKGRRIELRGFGTFYPYKRSARAISSPVTGVIRKVKACTMLKFRASKDTQRP
jgi:nucleoid DNA-binding protein